MKLGITSRPFGPGKPTFSAKSWIAIIRGYKKTIVDVTDADFSKRIKCVRTSDVT
jgi:hypothetical protein